MRIGLTVDSACDLPWSFIKENNIFVLPIAIRVGDKLVEDTRDPELTQQFYESGVLDKGHDVETLPYSTDQIRELFLDKVVVDYDFAFIQTVTRTRSPLNANAQEAMQQIMAEYRQRRQDAGVSGPFSMRVVDSKTMFAGQGVLAAETIRLIKQGVAKGELRQRVENLAANTYGYAVAPDVYYLRERSRKKGDNSVGFIGAMLGRALDIVPIIKFHQGESDPVAKVRGFEAGVQQLFSYTERRIAHGLLAPYVCISYAGDENVIQQLPGYDHLAAVAEEHGVELLTCTMGTTGAVNIGPGALSLAFITEPHEYDAG